jgi:DNA repair exonuclease SbcCD nuclease subunit
MDVMKMAENMQENNHVQAEPSEQQERRDDVVTIVLTADNHLGYAGVGQHRKQEERQQRLRGAFQQASDFAIAQGVDLFIQVGDLFDTITPDERDRSFVAERLAQLKQAGVQTFALGGVHDTSPELTSDGDATLAPQMSFARLGALHYFSPVPQNANNQLEPVITNLHGVTVGLCGLGVLAGQEGDPLAHLRVSSDIETATIAILLLHAPIEGLADGSSLLDSRALVSHASIGRQSIFKYILAGYHHAYRRLRIAQTELVVPGASQHFDFATLDHAPGFIFMGLAADGIRWCNHIPVDSLVLRRLIIDTKELWSASSSSSQSPTSAILERLRPLCDNEAMVQLRLEGELTRNQYHELDLNQIRRYGEEHCFALAIDDSAITLPPEQDVFSSDSGERLSPREELVALADEWIARAVNEQDKKALRDTKEELLLAMDEAKTRY